MGKPRGTGDPPVFGFKKSRASRPCHAQRGKETMAKALNLFTTIKGSLLENFYPAGWDLRRMDRCCTLGLKGVTTRQKFWNAGFDPKPVKDVTEMDRRMGDAIADQI